MKLPSNLIATYKHDILAFLFLLIPFGILLSVFWSHTGFICIDNGREAYVPQEILNGSVLYKDLLIYYGPFSYQLNALLFKLLGAHLNTLYLIGTANALLILLCIYLIIRNFTTITISWLTCFLVISAFFFSNSPSNYIFPYSYGMIFALSSFLLAFLCCILYIRQSKVFYIPVAAFFMGISLLSKYEFIIFIAAFLILILFVKPVSARHLVYTIIAFLIMPVICWGFLFTQGLNIADLQKSFDFVVNLTNTPLFKNLYTYSIGFYPSLKMIKITISLFSIIMLLLFVSTGIIYGLLSMAKNKSGSFRITIFTVITIITLLISFKFTTIVPYEIFTASFSWLPFSTALILIFICLNMFSSWKDDCKNNNNKSEHKASCSLKSFISYFQTIDLKDKLFIFLVITALLTVLKCFFFVTTHTYGAFLLLLVLIVNIIFLFNYIPAFISKIDSTTWTHSCIVFLTAACLFFFIKNIVGIQSMPTYAIETPKGTIYARKHLGPTFEKTLKYINDNFPETASFLMIPDGSLLNFLSNRPVVNYYCEYFPVNVETTGDKKLIEDLRQNPPDYIVVTSSDYMKVIFGKDYGKSIYKYIQKNYTLEKEFNESISIKIFAK